MTADGPGSDVARGGFLVSVHYSRLGADNRLSFTRHGNKSPALISRSVFLTVPASSQDR